MECELTTSQTVIAQFKAFDLIDRMEHDGSNVQLSQPEDITSAQPIPIVVSDCEDDPPQLQRENTYVPETQDIYGLHAHDDDNAPGRLLRQANRDAVMRDTEKFVSQFQRLFQPAAMDMGVTYRGTVEPKPPANAAGRYTGKTGLPREADCGKMF